MKAIAPPTTDPRPDRTCVAAVAVTYHPDPGVYDRVRALVGQVRAILIVDNGSTDAELEPVQRLVAEGVAELIRNGENRGQATALNQGLEWARDLGVPWVLTLDQDTTPSGSLVEGAADVFDAFPARSVAVIGASKISRPGPPGVEVATVITSGSLHSVAVWRVIGRFRDDFFIDCVDSEYCLRARRAGYAVVRGYRPTMMHSIGDPTRHRLLVRSVRVSNHSHVRRYYIMRNRIYMWRAYWRDEPGYITYDMRAALKEFIKLLLVERDRRAKVQAIVRGLRDAMRGRTGPLAPLRSHRS